MTSYSSMFDLTLGIPSEGAGGVLKLGSVTSLRINGRRLRYVGDYPDLGAVDLKPGEYATDCKRGLIKWREPEEIES